MPLVKRILFWIFLVLAIGGAVWGYFYLKQSKKPKVDAVSVLPDSCLVYVNTPDFFELNKKLNSQNLLVDKLKLFKDIAGFCGTLQLLDSLLSTNELLQKEVDDNIMHFALYKNQSWVVAFNTKQLGDQDVISEQIVNTFHASKTENENFVFRLGLTKQVYFNLRSGVVILSDSKETLDLALNTTLPKLAANKKFLEFKTTLEENSPLSIYTDHNLYAQSKAASKLNLSALFKKGYSAGTIDLQPSQITVNGFVSSDSTEIISLLSNQEAQAPDFINVLPLGVSSFTAYGFHAYPELQKKRSRIFPATTGDYWKLVNDSALYNLESDFYQNISGCLVSFETQFPKQQAVLLKMQDTAKITEQLRLMSDSAVYFNSVPVYRLKKPDNDLRLFLPLSGSVTRYAARYDAYIFFSETKEGLTQILSDLKNGSLMNNESFVSYKNQNFPEAFNFLIYSSPNLVQENSQTFFNFKASEGTNPFENFKHFSFCLTNDANHFKFRWHLLNEAETVNKDQNVLWTLALDTESSMKAATFVNHITKENELVIQDNANKLYLINAKGTVLWKKMLDEKIESPVFTVDLYKNEKYQILFNTKNYLHLIDRNGNYVKGYPVKLPAEASAAMAIFDYDADKDYRLLIPCKNNTIYNYAITGQRQEKFVPVKTESEVNLPLQYANVGPSDYLVALDKDGKIYTFSRKGAGRIGLTNKTIANCSAFYIDATSNINSTFLVYADDKNSLINKISFSDRKEIVKINSDISNAQVNFGLIDENRTMDVIFTKPNSISAYDLNGNVLFEKNTEGDFSKTNFYSDESRSLFYAVNATGDELLLIDQLKGKSTVYKASAMPLICDLFSDNKRYLLVTDGKRLNCLLLN